VGWPAARGMDPLTINDTQRLLRQFPSSCPQPPYEWSGQKSLPATSVAQPWLSAHARTSLALTAPA
jgi:hypothetical protein